jgi:hypothetical protein
VVAQDIDVIFQVGGKGKIETSEQFEEGRRLDPQGPEFGKPPQDI